VTDQEISPQSWEYRLVAAVVYAVEQRARGSAGGPRTRWNGRVIEETDPHTLGSAHGDGTMSVSVQKVIAPLLKARDLDRPLTDDEAWLVRDAMDTLTHEATHFLAREGDMSAPEAYPYDKAAAAFDEGRVEHWTKRNLDLVINDVFTDAGLDKVAEQVLAQPNIDAYPAYTAAVRQLDDALADRSGLSSAEVTNKLMSADDSQRWNDAVDMVIDKQLVEPGLMPEAHRAEVRRQLVAPLRRTLSDLADIQTATSMGRQQKVDAAGRTAQNAIAKLDTELNRIERHYRVAIAQRTQQESQRPESRLNQATNQARQLPPDLKRLQAVTSGQAPAAGATSRSAGSTDHAVSDPDNGSRGKQAPGRRSGPQAPGIG
jgi:hypothetical protein